MITRVSGLIAIAVAASTLIAPGAAQAFSNTWVSGLGSDGNSCLRNVPCRTFAGALSKTDAGGRISCVDSGDYGTLTIDKSITIACDGVEARMGAGIQTAIVVDAAATDVVVLSGLHLEGTDPGFGAMGDGLQILQAASVRVLNTKILDFDSGIEFLPSAAFTAASLEVRDCVIADNRSHGIRVAPTSSAVAQVTVDHSQVSRSGVGIAFIATSTTGAVKGVVSDSVIANNQTSGVTSRSNGASSQLVVDRSSVFANNRGLVAEGAGAIIRFTNSNLFGNGTGVAQSNSGFVFSFGTNVVVGNAFNGAFGTTPLK